MLLDKDAVVGATLVGSGGLRALHCVSIMLVRQLLLLLLAIALIKNLSTLRSTESRVASSSHLEGRLAHFDAPEFLTVVLYHGLVVPPGDSLHLLRLP